jgi:hypothetical protein
MEANGSICGPNVLNLIIYQVTFAMASYYGSVHLHRDNAADLSGEAWAVVFSQNDVNNSPSELVEQSPHTEKAVLVKYDLETTCDSCSSHFACHGSYEIY